MPSKPIQRCGWCTDDPLYQHYHDQEWGKPLHDAAALFELLCLEGQQAGLAWITVLKKRAAYRQHFFQYSIAQIADFSDLDIELKLSDSGLIRHKSKLFAIRSNAQAWLQLEAQNIDVAKWLWSFVKGQVQMHDVQHYSDIPSQTPESIALSKALKHAGFKFVGPTTCYAFMQACGMVNDHENLCHAKAAQFT